jgi:murein L,D-transpeptidase YafK
MLGLKQEMKSTILLIFFFLLLTFVVHYTEAQSAKEEPADRIVIEKAARKLMLYRGQNAIRTYCIALGGQPTGKKQCQGDNRTPEGQYIIDGRNKNSRYHWSLHVSYPNQADRERAKIIGCNPGGDIMIHGLANGYGWIGKLHTAHDWTLGCIAVTDKEIEEIWELVPNGTPVVINP